MANAFLNTRELAKYLDVSIPTIQRWRTERNGCPFIKRGGIVRYDIEDVKKWLESHKIDHSAMQGGV